VDAPNFPKRFGATLLVRDVGKELRAIIRRQRLGSSVASISH
jgi:hypothetical protein